MSGYYRIPHALRLRMHMRCRRNRKKINANGVNRITSIDMNYKGYWSWSDLCCFTNGDYEFRWNSIISQFMCNASTSHAPSHTHTHLTLKIRSEKMSSDDFPCNCKRRIHWSFNVINHLFWCTWVEYTVIGTREGTQSRKLNFAIVAKSLSLKLGRILPLRERALLIAIDKMGAQIG